jgi:hypothetical protein
MRNLFGDRAVPLPLRTVADQTIGPVERLTFFEGLRRCMIRVLQFAASANGFLFPRPVSNGSVASGNGARHWTLQREAIAGDLVWSKRLISRVACQYVYQMIRRRCMLLRSGGRW